MTIPKILIVGAGPVGLTLANLLIHYGIDYHIIDMHSGISVLSKALAMHARTLELFEELNLSQEFIDNGRIIREANIYADDKRLVHVDLSKIPSKYNFVLSIEQSHTEQVLEARLIKEGKKIHWNNELLEIIPSTNKTQVKIRDEKQNIQELEFDYVCSCEGAHSIIRKQTQIDFSGGSYDQGFLLADVIVDTDLKPQSIYGFLNQNKLFATIPLKQEKRWRIITAVANDYPNDLNQPNIEDVLKVTQGAGPKNFTIEQADWISRFHVHHRIVNSYRKNNIFLLGDAAHIHSPIGGQGMNAGMHDAFNLASKFRSVLLEKDEVKILDAYDKERRGIGHQIVNGTDLATRILLDRNYFSHKIQKFIAPIMFSNKAIRRKLIKNLSMLQ